MEERIAPIQSEEETEEKEIAMEIRSYRRYLRLFPQSVRVEQPWIYLNFMNIASHPLFKEE